jgi:hypothetical protein
VLHAPQRLAVGIDVVPVRVVAAGDKHDRLPRTGRPREGGSQGTQVWARGKDAAWEAGGGALCRRTGAPALSRASCGRSS